MVLVILACSLLGIGIGQTAISTLGIPYIDDNVASKDSPMYIAITIGVRILGPAGGFILGSFCTRIAVNLQETALSPSDPKYIGAWWLGKFYIYDVHKIYANLIHCKLLRQKKKSLSIKKQNKNEKKNNQNEISRQIKRRLPKYLIFLIFRDLCL